MTALDKAKKKLAGLEEQYAQALEMRDYRRRSQNKITLKGAFMFTAPFALLFGVLAAMKFGEDIVTMIAMAWGFVGCLMLWDHSKTQQYMDRKFQELERDLEREHEHVAELERALREQRNS